MADVRGSDRSVALGVLLRIVKVAVLGVASGVAGGLAAIGFVELIHLSDRWLIAPLLAPDGFGFTDWLWVCAALVAGGALVSGLRFWPSPAAFQGVAHTIAAAHSLERFMALPVAFRSIAASLVSLCCGASVGQYGPLAHLGATLGLGLSRLTGMLTDARNIVIACGIAAAISTAFHTPIAGVVFAHEVVLRHFSLRAFAPVTLASSVGYLLARMLQGSDPLFVVAVDFVIQPPEYALFAVVGVLGGVIAVILMRAVGWSRQLAMRSRVPEWLQPMLAGFLLALIAFFVPEAIGIGAEPLKNALDGGYPGWELGVILIAKLIATALCLGFGFVGGLFSPALLVGVMFGALFGQSVWVVFNGEYSDLVTYAACGMVAVVSPVIGAPLSAILLIFELTGNYVITTAAMFSVVLSNLVSYRLYGRSFFDHLLAEQGCNMNLGRENLRLYSQSISQFVTTECPRLYSDQTPAEAARIMQSNAIDTLPVFNSDDNSFIGMLNVRDIAYDSHAPSDSIASIVRDDGARFTRATSLGAAMEVVRVSPDTVFPVFDAQGGFVGSVSSDRLIKARMSVGREALRETHAAN